MLPERMPEHMLEHNAALVGLALETVQRLAAIATSPLPETYRFSSTPPSLTVNGRPLHSRDPEREADAAVRALAHPKKNVFFFYGLGLAHTCLAFAHARTELLGDRDHTSIRVIIVEPDPVIAAVTLSHIDLSPLAAFKISLIIADSADAVLAEVMRILPPETIKGVAAAVLNGLPKEKKEFARECHEAVIAWMEREYSNIVTRFNFNSIWTRNIIANAPALARTDDIRALKGQAHGLPAIIAAGGPTLNAAMESIRRYRTGYALIAVDTALAPLAKAGITPDIVVTVDAGFYNYLDFVIDQSAVPCLVMEISAYPAIAHANAERLFFFARRTEHDAPIPFAGALAGDAGITTLASSSTVASTAIDLAAFAGFSSILLAGHDLSYPDLETHAKHANAYEYFLARTGRLSPLPSLAFAHLYRRAVIEDGIATDFILSQQAAWYSTMASRYPSMQVRRLRGSARRLPVEEGIITGGIPGAMDTIRRIISAASAERRYHGIASTLAGYAHHLDTVRITTAKVMDAVRTGNTDASKIETEIRTFAQAMSKTVPFLADGIAYMVFSIDRREGDSAAVRAHALAAELSKLAVYFGTRIHNAISRMGV